jgi:hypothetical protein
LNLVRLPKEKNPPGILKVVAVRCRACCSCPTCGGWGWGFRSYVGRRESKCAQYESAPTPTAMHLTALR